MKARGLASPDLADTLAMSLSVNVQAKPDPVDPEADAAYAHLARRLRAGFGHWI
jgi:hypothetical protein